jgi:hypothetical protein
MKGAAQQFEAVFLQMVLKAMRDASPKEGMFDSEQTPHVPVAARPAAGAGALRPRQHRAWRR